MTLNVSPITEPVDSDSVSSTAAPVQTPDVTPNVFIGTKPVLKNWKMYGPPATDIQEDEPSSQTAQADEELDLPPELKEEDFTAPRNYTSRAIRTSKPVAPIWLQIGQAVAVFATVAWLSYAAIYILALPNSIKMITSSPLTLGGILASVLAPVAMVWLCLATWQRRSDAHIYAEALRNELRGLFYPDADQSNLIGEDIRELMRQATEMTATSRGAIKAIQRARTGLRAEIRDFAGVSQKAEFHIDRLADALAKRAEELLSLTETIELQTENISSKAQRGVTMWETCSVEISELGEELDQMFDAGTEKLQNASEAAKSRVQEIETDLNKTVESLTNRLEDVAVQFDATRDDLDGQANRLQDVATAISNGSERLETSLADAENIYGAVQGMMTTMADSLGKVEGTAETFYARTNEIEKKLETRADALKDSADKLLNSTDDLQEVGDLATHKLAEALSLALSGADTITNAVRKSKDMMDKAVVEASTQIAETSKIADDKLDALMNEARANRDQLQKIISEIEEQQAKLSTTAQKIDDRRSELSSAVDRATTSLDDSTSKMVRESEKPLKFIMSSIDQLQVHTIEMESKLAARTVEIQQENSKLKILVEGIDQTVKGSVDKLVATTSTIEAQAKSILDTVEGQREGLQSFVSEMDSKSGNIVKVMETRRDVMETSIRSTEERLTSLGEKFVDKGDTLVGKVSFLSDTISNYEQKLNESILSVNAKYGEVAEKVSGQIKYMTQLSEFIAPESDRILSKIDTVHEKYDELRKECFEMADDATERLVSFSDKLEDKVVKLGIETKATSQVLMSMSSDLTSTLSGMKHVAEEAHDRIELIQTGMKGRVEDLHLISDRVQMKVESMQNNLGTYAKDLNDVLHLTISDLELATEKFGQTTSILDDKTNNVTARIIDASRQYIEEGHRMSLMGEQTVHKSARMVEVIQQETDKLIGSARASLLELQKSGDTLSVRTKEIEEYLKSSTQHTKNYGDELRNQASLIASHSSDVVDVISAATVKLTSKASDVKNAGQKIIDEMEIAGVRLEEGTNVLGRVARITIEAVDDAVTGFSEHGNILKNTVDGLATQIKNVKDVQLRTERETFLSSAKFVIESLYSLAVDVSRHMEGELDVRVLRNYQKGDVSAYVRHLVDIAPKMPIDKSQRKFIEDGEFRTYVLRFIRQYEELLEQAQANDYGDLLSSVFSTSDIGKLYKVLCEIAGRSSREH